MWKTLALTAKIGNIKFTILRDECKICPWRLSYFDPILRRQVNEEHGRLKDAKARATRIK